MPSRERRKQELVRFPQVKRGTRAKYLVKNIIPAQALILVYGDPKTGKSFWAMDVGWHIAAGEEYRGLKVQQGPVVYIPFEGEGGMQDRIGALCQERGEDSCNDMWLAPGHPSVSVAAIRETLQAFQEEGIVPVLTIFDTLAASMVGGENEAEDVQQNYVRHLQRIVRETGSSVMIIHHASKDGKGPRGSSALPATVDCQIYISISRKRGQDNVITSEVELMKDGPEGSPMGHYLRRKSWAAEDGEEVSSCFLEPVPEGFRLRRKDKEETTPSPQTTRGLKLALELQNRNGSGKVRYEEWQEVCMRTEGGLVQDKGRHNQNTRAQAFKRVKETLIRSKKLVEIDEEHFCIEE
jgi:AAA domain